AGGDPDPGRELAGGRADAGLGVQHGHAPADAEQDHGPVQALGRQGRPLRERDAGHRAGPAELLAAVLRGGDALRHLRHRGHLHLPVGGHLRRARHLRLRRDGQLHRAAVRRLHLRMEEGGPRMGL
ncbi:MAG: NADH ubiquinone oxidoreductase chain A, partial [uncultured Thermomicrobiales bacterium]